MSTPTRRSAAKAPRSHGNTLATLAPSTPATTGKAPSAAQDNEFIHPATNRPARGLLEHEQKLLVVFYVNANPHKLLPTPREAEEWRLCLPEHMMDQWNSFVAMNQTAEEAEARLKSVSAHDLRIIEIKQQEELAQRRQERQDYLARKALEGEASTGRKRKSDKTISPRKGKKVKTADEDVFEDTESDADIHEDTEEDSDVDEHTESEDESDNTVE